MLDRLNQLFNPAALQTERASIEDDLARLVADSEELRIEAGLKVIANNSGDSSVDREVRAMTDKRMTITDQIRTLRARRREIDRLLTPPTDAAETVSRVERPADLVKVQADLDEARDDREALRLENARAFNAGEEGDGKKIQAKIVLAEQRITALRRRRAELLIPYNAAVAIALAPVVAAAAEKLAKASDDAREALSALMACALEMPSGVRGASGLERAATINQTPLHDASAFAASLLSEMRQ